MSNKIKQEIEKIQIPPELHQRSIMGIKQARLEENETRNNQSGSLFMQKLRNNKILIASFLGFVLISSVLLNTQVLATIQKALQFIPGIGIVQENDHLERYFLQQPVTVPMGNGTLVITGMVVDKEMTFITIDGTNVSKLDRIIIINDEGIEFTIERSSWYGELNNWFSSFWHQGKIDIQESISIVFEGSPEIKVPLTLEKAKSYSSYSDMGEVDNIDGIEIIAIPDRVGDQARISLVSQHSKNFRIDDFGIDMAGTEYQKLYVTDETGKEYDLERYQGLSSPSREFYFDISGTDDRVYSIVLPEINVVYDDTAQLSLPIPQSIQEDVNQTFHIAGFPVKITKLERLDIEGVDDMDGLRIYVDLKYDESAKESLYIFNFAGLSTASKLNEQTRIVEYIEFDIAPEDETINLTIERPQVIVRGPWEFEIPSSKYFSN